MTNLKNDENDARISAKRATTGISVGKIEDTCLEMNNKITAEIAKALKREAQSSKKIKDFKNANEFLNDLEFTENTAAIVDEKINNIYNGFLQEAQYHEKFRLLQCRLNQINKKIENTLPHTILINALIIFTLGTAGALFSNLIYGILSSATKETTAPLIGGAAVILVCMLTPVVCYYIKNIKTTNEFDFYDDIRLPIEKKYIEKQLDDMLS